MSKPAKEVNVYIPNVATCLKTRAETNTNTQRVLIKDLVLR